MSWLERHYDHRSPINPAIGNRSTTEEPVQESGKTQPDMSPGLEGDYDWKRRMMAGVHEPPPPPENMGLQGEYDPEGLAKRVLLAFDQNPELEDIETLFMEQQGDTILFHGSVPDRNLLDRLVEIAAAVDGVKAVNTDAVQPQRSSEGSV